MKTTCIMCPVGCQLNIEKKGKEIVVTGNSCIRGKEYGISEFTHPVRIVTALIKTAKGVLPVKTTKPIPKEKIADVLKELGNVNLKTAKFNEVIINNILGLESDVIVTGTVRK